MMRNQQNGTLVPPDDPAAMAAAIALLLEAPGDAVTMARRAREEVEQYTWSQVRGAWTDLYRNQSEAAAPF
jgi:glycosyltransferase involved in cell wall biosynthesis